MISPISTCLKIYLLNLLRVLGHAHFPFRDALLPDGKHSIPYLLADLSPAFAMMARNHFMSEGLSQAGWLNQFAESLPTLGCWTAGARCGSGHVCEVMASLDCPHPTLGFPLGCDWVSTMNVSLKPDFSFGSSFSDFLWLQTGAPWGQVLNF